MPTPGARSGTASSPAVEVFCARLAAIVDLDSPSGGVEQERVAELVAGWLEPLGCTAEWVDEPDGPARSMVVTLPGAGRPVVSLLGHTDTVFPHGTVAERPFRRDGDRCLGPGVADMKGGLVLAAMATERLAAAPDRPFAEIRLLLCADEEIRLRAPAVCERARGSAAALVFECGRATGAIVSARKGAIWRTLHLTGRAAHAGADTHKGRSAVTALAREVARIEGLVDGRPEMTSVVTTVAGGDAANTVPGWARATLDIRSSVPGDLDHALAELGREPAADGVTASIEDRGTWPPMPRVPWLAGLALECATAARLSVGEEHSGGVSDGCWTGAWGIPTLDGLGPVGGDDHTAAEWIEVATLERRLDMVTSLVDAVCRGQRGA